VNWTLEVVCLPVTDVDRTKEFYAGKLGFTVDFDSIHGDTRVVQVTPPGSGCSIAFGVGIMDEKTEALRVTGRPPMAPGSLQGVQLVVPDIKVAHAELAARGVEVTEIHVYGQNGAQPYTGEDQLDNVGFFFFTDPDGNGWAVQQISSRS
jgi:catechol 2,3-dioxygenase-like lactoylglutathione lyase family enzyme